ncbi:MAG: DNA-directed RNA polymerase subunit B'' [Candidatus Woesearchaeota archaeon]
MNKIVNPKADVLFRRFFQDVSPMSSNINSFNYFIDVMLQQIIEENKYIEPTIIPQNIDDFKIRLDKIWITTPEITEADGSKRELWPHEARIRSLTYSAPIYLTVSAHINGIQRESFTTQIGNMPIMLKSKFCHLSKMTREQLIAAGEDPDELGGYFIVNGTEKSLIHIEDLASNKFMVEKKTLGTVSYEGRLFSEYEAYKIPHSFELLNDGIVYVSFTRMKRVPVVVLLKALGMEKDDVIVRSIGAQELQDEIFVNLFDFVGIKTAEDAQDWIAKKMGITQTKDIRLERVNELLDRFLFPHLGTETKFRELKAQNLAKLMKRFLYVSSKRIPTDDKDHYINKRIKMSGDLLADLFRANLRVLIDDLLYNFQRIVKRGKFPSIKVIIRDKLLTSRIYSAMATGNWVGGRKGISQRIQRMNYLDMMSHLQRVVSPLSTSQENFEARALHPTHMGRLCPVETPEGTNVGLRKNLALLSEVSLQADETEVLKVAKSLGLKTI